MRLPDRRRGASPDRTLNKLQARALAEAQQGTYAGVRALMRMIRSKNTTDTTRLRAIRMLLEYGLGKPSQEIVHVEASAAAEPLEAMSPAERVRVLEVALAEQRKLAAECPATESGEVH